MTLITSQENYLKSSLYRQKCILKSSIPLTPVDSIPFFTRENTEFLHGLYISDKVKSNHQKKESIISFPGRSRATFDVNMIHSELANLLGGEAGSLRLLSGLHAHLMVFMSLSKPGDSVLLLPENGGGHFATHSILERLGLRIINIPIDEERMRVDRERTILLIEKEKPNFIFIDRSEGLVYEDFSYLGDFKNAIKIFDASQYLPQIIFNQYENPIKWGFDLMLFSVHKSFPGPQKAGVVSRKKGDVWKNLVKGLGSYVSSAHIENTYNFGLVISNLSLLESYSNKLSKSALKLEECLMDLDGYVVDRSIYKEPKSNYTQHLWLSCRDKSEAFNIYRNLELARIHVNYRKLPYNLGWGIRIGTTSAIALGINDDTIVSLANVIKSIIYNGFCLRHRHLVRDIRKTMEENRLIEWPRMQ